jgi:hypothetical protein
MEEKIFLPQLRRDVTTEPDKWYRLAIASADGNNIIKVEKGGGWHLVEVLKTSKEAQYRYLGEKNWR